MRSWKRSNYSNATVSRPEDRARTEKGGEQVKRSWVRVSTVLLHTLLLWAPWLQAASDPEVRAYVNDTCIVADEPFYLPEAAPEMASDAAPGTTQKALPLVGIVVGKLAELMLRSAVKATAGKISSRARKDTRYAVARQINLFRADLDPAPSLSLNARLGCMTIVAGNFLPDPAECASEYLPRTVGSEMLSLPETQWRTSRTDDSLGNPLRRANICMAGPPRAVYESRFEFSADGTAYRLQNAGYRVDSLLTSDSPKASRSAFYTLEISQPGRDASNEVLSTAWVNLGTIKAGDRVADPPQQEGRWLRVPALSVEARRAYEEQTRVHQSVAGEIAALERAILRNRRLLDGLEQRVAGARAAVAKGLKEQALKTEVQIQTLGAEIDARKSEYADLPQAPLEFMPVSIEVGVTEKTSEKRALTALAQAIDAGSGEIASMAVTAGSGLIHRSIDGEAANSADPGVALEAARNQYFDARLALKETDSADARETLTMATEKYNAARRALALEPIK